ncbi:MAG: hypothetical protein Unbinned2404contig1000_48 [Prokaryotic dsDNA virus sp.]|nr:MAG: hypothetical protein Unbinned2404contig1000_48 [Prokaryotic dsDNA virus sp.]
MLGVIIAWLIYVTLSIIANWDDTPWTMGTQRETTYRPKGSAVNGEHNLSHAAMFMNIDE